MTPFDQMFPTEDDLDHQFVAALAEVPEEKRAYWSNVWALVRSMETHLGAIQTDLRDCNVILARTIDRCERFSATGGLW
jgi:hypothetical protein